MALTIDPETGRFVPTGAGQLPTGRTGSMDLGPFGMRYRPGQQIPIQQEPVGIPNFPRLTPGQLDISSGLPVLKGPSSLPGSRTGFLTPGQQAQRGARAGTLGVRQGPVFAGKPAFSPLARASLRPGMSLTNQIRQLMGGRFGNRPTLAPGTPLSFGLLGQQGPASGGQFGFQGGPFGRLGQRGR